MAFEDKFETSEDWHKQRYLRIITEFKGIELTDEEKGYLLWLASYDSDTEEVFKSLFHKLKK